MRITVTAFEPFGGFTTNSSFQGLKDLHDGTIDKIFLPVAYPDAFNIFKQEVKNTDFIILLGMAAKRKLISFEFQAKNILSFKIPDNKNNLITNRKIDESKPDVLTTLVDIDKLINYFNKNEEIVYKSTDAGEYICNYLYFEVLNNYNIPSIFIHIPNYDTKEEFKFLNEFLVKLINYIKGEEK